MNKTLYVDGNTALDHNAMAAHNNASDILSFDNALEQFGRPMKPSVKKQTPHPRRQTASMPAFSFGKQRTAKILDIEFKHYLALCAATFGIVFGSVLL